MNLLSRGWQVGDSCGVRKTLWHSFVVCPFAVGCWKEGGIEFIANQVRDRSESFFEMLSRGGDDVNIKLGMLLWKIWKDRSAGYGRISTS